MRIKVKLEYEYDVNPEHYPESHTPYAMAKFDIETDPTIILDAMAENFEISADEVTK